MQQTTLWLTLICIIIISSCLNLPTSNCEKYKKGTFYYHFKNDGKTMHYTVTRNDSIQTEINDDNGNAARFKIRWLDNCSYELSFIDGTEVLPKELSDLKKTMLLRTTILSGTKNYYLFKSTSNIDDHVLSDTIWLVK